MAQQIINIGASANDGTGDDYRTSFEKVNSNFTELFLFHPDNNIIEISQESDFPTQDSSTITIESGTGYFITKPFTTIKRFIMEGGSISSVVTDIPFITYTGTGVMFTATQKRMRVDSLVLSCPNATVFQVTGDGTKSLSFRGVANSVVVLDCDGVFNAINGGIMTLGLCNFNCPTTGSAITLSGTGAAVHSLSKVVIENLGFGGIALDMGLTVNDEIEIDNMIVSGNPNAIAISGLTNSGNITVGGNMMVDNSNFSALTNPLLGVKENDVRIDFDTNSPNVSNSRNAADAFITGGSETVSINVIGVFVEIGVPVAVGVSWASDIQDRFTVGADGVITYIGERPISVQLIGKATVDKVGGGSDEIEVRFAKNWIPGQNGIEKSRSITQNSTPTSVPIGALVDIVQNDNIRVIFANNGSIADILADVTSFQITGR